MLKIRYKAVVLSVALLGGCASAPPEVTASRNLISAPVIASFTQLIPSELSQRLNQQPSGTKFDYQNLRVTLGRFYISALGQNCRELILVAAAASPSVDNQQQRITCQNDNKMWIMIPQVVESTNKPLEFTG